MSSHQMSAKPRSSKCSHFCFPFNSHNYCPTRRESGKGDDHCVTNQSPCNICAIFYEEQQIKIKRRRRYIRKQKTSIPNISKDDFDILGDDGDALSGSQIDLEGAADNLFLRAVGVLFSPMVSGWAGGQVTGRSLSGLYLRNHKV